MTESSNFQKLYLSNSYENVSGYKCASIDDISKFQSNSFNEIVIKNSLHKASYTSIFNIITDIKRVLIPNGLLIIHFFDLVNLLEQYKKNKLSILDINQILFSNSQSINSLIDKTEITNILTKLNFTITSFEYSDSSSWDDYNCIIKADNVKEDYNLSEFSKEDRFSGIDFGNDDDQDLDFDYDLFNEVLITEKHPEKLDYNLLSEVMDYSPEIIESSKKFEDKKSDISNEGGKLLQEIINIDFKDSLTESHINYDSNHELRTNFKEASQEKTYHKNIGKIGNQPALNIVWEGSQFVYNSNALVNRAICTNLIESGVANVTIVPFEADDVNFDKNDTNSLLIDNDIRRKPEVSKEIAKLPYAWIRHHENPKSDPPKGAKWIILQDWNYSLLTKEVYKVINNADEIWTTSFYSRNSMINSGIEFNKVQVISPGINPDLFTPYGDKYNLNCNKKFKFLFVGDLSETKGVDLVIEAFSSSFTKDDDVALIIKGLPNKNNLKFNGNFSNNKWQYNSAEITVIEDTLSEEQMASLYRACDIIVAPYRNTSFGISLLEAMACGLPVIATRGGASDDFLEEAFTYFISSEKRFAGLEYDGKEFIGNVEILEPSLSELIDGLLYFYTNPSNVKSMGAIASAYARTKWNWYSTTIKVLRRLDYLYNTKMSVTAENFFGDVVDDSIVFGTAEHSFISQDFDNAVNLYMQSAKGKISERYRLLALHRIALILINKNENYAAEEILDTVKKLHFGHPDTKYLEVILKAAQSQNTEALEIISGLMDNWKDDKFISDLGNNLDDILVLTGDLLFATNDIESAHSLYTTALSMNPNNSYACYGAGMCFKESGMIEDAKKMLEWAIRIDSEFELAKEQLNKL
ncbi:hypothetical protein MASR1M45_04200 [Candidatus Kapaibacterium sp.]